MGFFVFGGLVMKCDLEDKNIQLRVCGVCQLLQEQSSVLSSNPRTHFHLCEFT